MLFAWELRQIVHESNFAIEIENICRFHTEHREQAIIFITPVHLLCLFKPKFQGQSDKWGWGGGWMKPCREREREKRRLRFHLSLLPFEDFDSRIDLTPWINIWMICLHVFLCENIPELHNYSVVCGVNSQLTKNRSCMYICNSAS